VGGWAVEQLWLFWVAPIIGAALAGAAYQAFASEETIQATKVSGRIQVDEKKLGAKA
jgi:aquaporin Z